MRSTLTCSVLLLTALLFQPAAAFAGSKKLCINIATGQITQKSKCRTGVETEFSRSSFTTPDAQLSARVDTATADVASLQTSLAQLIPSQIYNVATSGSAYSSVAAAIAAAQSAGASTTNPAVIRIAPGTYSQSGNLTVPSGVALVGSGIAETILLVDAVDSNEVIMSSNSSAENLTVKRTINDTHPLVYIGAATGVTLRRLKLTHSGAASLIGVYVTDSTATLEDLEIAIATTGDLPDGLTLRNSTVDAWRLRITVSGNDFARGISVSSGGTFQLYDSSVTINGSVSGATGIQFSNNSSGYIRNTRFSVTSPGTFGPNAIAFVGTGTLHALNSDFSCSGTGGNTACIFGNAAGTVSVVNSRIDASAALETVRAYSGVSIKVANTQMKGAATTTFGGGTVTCGGVTDENFTFSASTCP